MKYLEPKLDTIFKLPHVRNFRTNTFFLLWQIRASSSHSYQLVTSCQPIDLHLIIAKIVTFWALGFENARGIPTVRATITDSLVKVIQSNLNDSVHRRTKIL